ncbi:scavenger receptor cysteine-rich type 1 protein M130 [Salmo salar]|uniref:Scavenger receptor cysteine-rich type 1 protein M130 n=1 Tax=Salmo salar TaxID=8030 RepID=A0A1S3SM58_SALSA|nr:scavenger receptor cysteine-rich type 1 protein M130-like [Salmo salar]|eukprot:XP_014065401.1 PREDICTED: scavenger receptor cysteine-rich type 1 protein M130-like [Salmo salar]
MDSLLDEVKVVCKQMDCGYPLHRYSSSSGLRGQAVKCSGNESTLGECLVSPEAERCSYVGVACSDFVRLVGEENACSGRLEVKSNQSWASVCEADFNWQDAEVVCWELLCPDLSALQGGLYGEGEGQTWDKEFQCKGNESLLLDCSTAAREKKNCTHGNYVGLNCSTTLLGLLQGGSRCAGKVVLHHLGGATKAGTDWDINEATVVCRRLDCGSAVSATRGSYFGRGSGLVTQIYFSCRGSESELRRCPYSYAGFGSFSHDGDDAGVVCSDLLVQPDISLNVSTEGVSRGYPGPELLWGHSFTITCSTQPQYPGGSFLLTLPGINRTQTQPAVNHSAAFLFPAADDSHQGNYSCVYKNDVFSHNFSSESELLSLTVTASPLPAVIIRLVIVLLTTTAMFLLCKSRARSVGVNRELDSVAWRGCPCIPGGRAAGRERGEQLRGQEEEDEQEASL